MALSDTTRLVNCVPLWAIEVKTLPSLSTIYNVQNLRDQYGALSKVARNRSTEESEMNFKWLVFTP